ncbi:hypothetical protein PsYK624_168300 [Phanerochaete sordida]|uniref:Uncharacterized protein n=1 Tax=Phanerochaete sordida TaxID=48140 RepID=A0A9P3GSP8_9APHY|nr:hypothetical protein PsYK624_168300 [Phanerochaete sordida]
MVVQVVVTTSSGRTPAGFSLWSLDGENNPQFHVIPFLQYVQVIYCDSDIIIDNRCREDIDLDMQTFAQAFRERMQIKDSDVFLFALWMDVTIANRLVFESYITLEMVDVVVPCSLQWTAVEESKSKPKPTGKTQVVTKCQEYLRIDC